MCSVYNLAPRTAGCCSGWPEWQDAASAEMKSLKFPKYQSNKKNVIRAFCYTLPKLPKIKIKIETFVRILLFHVKHASRHIICE